MKLHRLTCNRAVDIGDASGYEVFACTCGREFRGIHAAECLADHLYWKFADPTVRVFTMGLAGRIDNNTLGLTCCPYCHVEIGIRNNPQHPDVTGPGNCWVCTRRWPTEPVDNLKKWVWIGGDWKGVDLNYPEPSGLGMAGRASLRIVR